MHSTFFLIACIFIVLFACLIWVQRKRAEFKDRFPPISDIEFVARCTPGTDPTVALKVRKMLADSLGVEYERVYPSSRLIADLGAE